MAFHNPYHFVPVQPVSKDGIKKNSDTKKFDFSTHPHVTHDRYTKDTYTGRVMCQLTAETPFVVGDKHDDSVEPTIVNQYELDGKPAIPASTLRGLISSIVETASNSSLRVLEDETYSYRKNAKEPLKHLGMIVEDKQTKKLQIMALCEFTTENPIDCVKLNLRNPNKFSTFCSHKPTFYYMLGGQRRGTTVEPITAEQHEKLRPAEQSKYKKGILRIMQELDSKGMPIRDLATHQYELFIEVKSKGYFNILDEAIKRFEKLSDIQTENNKDEVLPYHPIGTKRNENSSKLKNKLRLKVGDLIYYKLGESNQVTEISFSAIWRDLVGKVENHIKKADTTFDFFRNNFGKELLPFNKDRDQISLAEQMFGLVENNGDEKTDDEKLSLAGRIYPSVANWKGIIENGKLNGSTTDFYDLGGAEDDGLTLLKILASPKPPSPAMYFKSGYIAKNQLNAEQHQPQGRKFYLHNKSNEGRPWETKKPTENQKQKMKVKPLKANSVFNFYIDFENLSELELGALLYALRPSEEFRHKLGLGKPIGLGTVKIDVVELLKIDRAKRYSHLGLFKKRDESISSQIETLRSAFRTSNPDFCSILETIGDPEKVIEKVQYPTRNRQSDEGENFKWFVENDRNRKRNLLPIRESQNIPSLEEY